jgi:hypothetical protein
MSKEFYMTNSVPYFRSIVAGTAIPGPCFQNQINHKLVALLIHGNVPPFGAMFQYLINSKNTQILAESDIHGHLRLGYYEFVDYKPVELENLGKVIVATSHDL